MLLIGSVAVVVTLRHLRRLFLPRHRSIRIQRLVVGRFTSELPNRRELDLPHTLSCEEELFPYRVEGGWARATEAKAHPEDVGLPGGKVSENGCHVRLQQDQVRAVNRFLNGRARIASGR